MRKKKTKKRAITDGNKAIEKLLPIFQIIMNNLEKEEIKWLISLLKTVVEKSK